MNNNEINGAGFSGAAASNIITRTASAIAQAIVSGSGEVYRRLSVVIENASTVRGTLKNQFGGLILLAGTIAQETTLTARAIRLIAAKTVLQCVSVVTAALSKIYSVYSNVIVAPSTVIALLKNQYNGLITFTTNVAQSTVITARSFSIKAARSVVGMAPNVINAFSTIISLVKTTVENVAVEITANLVNQYNGIITFTADVLYETSMTAAMKATKFARVLVSSSSSITGFLVAVKFVKALVQITATSVVGILRNQFDEFVLLAANIKAATVVQARAIKNNLARTIVAQATNINARLFAVRRIKSLVTYGTTIVGRVFVIKRIAAILPYRVRLISKLSITNLAKVVISYTSIITNRFKARFAAKSTISSSAAITANLRSSTNAPASPENTFKVPEDDIQYDVEE